MGKMLRSWALVPFALGLFLACGSQGSSGSPPGQGSRGVPARAPAGAPGAARRGLRRRRVVGVVRLGVRVGFGLELVGATARPTADRPATGARATRCPPGLLNPDYTTQWNPGILADTPTGQALGAGRLARAHDDVRLGRRAERRRDLGDPDAPSTAAQGKNQVVMLAAGTYSVSSTLTVPGGVVLRGAGSDAADRHGRRQHNGRPRALHRHSARRGLLRRPRLRLRGAAAPHAGRDEGDQHGRSSPARPGSPPEISPSSTSWTTAK